jgi:non-specific protein-tyrosine kinase
LVLVAGPTPPNPAELLGSDRMTEILDELRASADVVIVDSPPLLPVTDAAVLAAKVDAVLLVASLAQTHRDAAKRAVTVLQATGSRLLGMVVNKTTTGHSSYYAGYYGEADEGEKESRRRRKGRKRRRRAAPVPPPLDGEWTPLPTGEPPSAAELPDRPRARARSRLRGR